MESLFEFGGGLLKVVGWLMGVFLIATLTFGLLYVIVWSVFFKMVAG